MRYSRRTTVKSRLAGTFDLPYDDRANTSSCIGRRPEGAHWVRTLDVASPDRLRGSTRPRSIPAHRRGRHLIDPTETDSVETLDRFADALIAIAGEAEGDP